MQSKWYINGPAALDQCIQVFGFESRTQAINMKFIALFFILVAVIATQAAPSEEVAKRSVKTKLENSLDLHKWTLNIFNHSNFFI